MIEAFRRIWRFAGKETGNINQSMLVGFVNALLQMAQVGAIYLVIRALTAANCGISFLYEAVVRGSPDIASFTCPPLTGHHELNVVFLQHTGAGELARKFVSPVLGV